MRIHQLLFLAMLMLSAPLLALLGGLSISSWQDYVEDRKSALTARATTAWIDGQVALSLERSLTQVAFAIEPADRAPLKQKLAEHRQIVDQQFARAQSPFEDGPLSQDRHLDEFRGKALFLLTELQETRRDVGVALQSPSSCEQSCDALVAELITVIDQTAVLRAALEIPSGDISTESYDTFQLKYLAWEAREFAGRIRTPYVIATLQSRPMSDPVRTLKDEHRRLGNQSWATLRNVSRRLDPDSPINEAIDAAQTLYYQQHLALLDGIDTALSSGAPQALPSFSQFFELSTAALSAISNVASISGLEIERYWQDRQAASLRSFWFTSLGSAFAIAVMAMVILALRAHLVRPIVNTTDLLSSLAAGDLEAREKPTSLALFEIKALRKVVERFRDGLRQARAAERDARTDHLTKLPNRRDMEEHLSHKAHAPFQDGDAFFYIDLDEFKPINDSFGHYVGDLVLQKTAERLQGFAADGNEVWRLGGDEFGLVVRGVGDAEQASFIADHLHDIVSAPIPHAGDDLYVGASIGVALQDETVLHPQDMISRADVAMFKAKQDPTKKFEIHRDTTQTRRYSNEVLRDITAALENGEIFPVYQPQIDLRTGGIIGFEALARWRRADGRLLVPSDFMEMVEYFGAQADLDLLIARRTLEAMREIQSVRKHTPRFSINVSEASLASREIGNGYLQLFTKYEDLTPQVTVEVTESALVDRSAQAIRATLQSFVKAGVSLSMDDFGTGYGSFRHLQEYQFDEIKIDRSFVSKVCFDHSSEVIISGFLGVARGLEAIVVAEGVESEDQRAKLLELGCRYAQGYLFSKPIPHDQLLRAIFDQSESSIAGGSEAAFSIDRAQPRARTSY